MTARAATLTPTPIPAFAPVERPPLLDDAAGVEVEALEIPDELDFPEADAIPLVDEIDDIVVLVLVTFGFAAL